MLFECLRICHESKRWNAVELLRQNPKHQFTFPFWYVRLVNVDVWDEKRDELSLARLQERQNTQINRWMSRLHYEYKRKNNIYTKIATGFFFSSFFFEIHRIEVHALNNSFYLQNRVTPMMWSFEYAFGIEVFSSLLTWSV